ncbi:hypothetical protein BCV71DRAFT_222508 [Rhizopus microsporus]|uniref:Uncharacterized protein n=1 Tax=Rhizopus microsporus TaxID=58291 RepID=A0A1X0RMU5_RHIZD|nr:hypothetical protein BCV71DRAFT_222508 [Rhizopus microsporus]
MSSRRSFWCWFDRLTFYYIDILYHRFFHYSIANLWLFTRHYLFLNFGACFL